MIAKKIMLVLPCAKWLNYNKVEDVKTWKIIIKDLQQENLLQYVDLWAVDCIKLKSTGEMIGLWNPFKDKNIWKEIKKEKLDNYPSWDKFKNNPILLEELKNKLKEKLTIEKNYNHIIAYLNVKAYKIAFENAIVELNLNYKTTIIVPKIKGKEVYSPFAFVKKENRLLLIYKIKELLSKIWT